MGTEPKNPNYAARAAARRATEKRPSAAVSHPTPPAGANVLPTSDRPSKTTDDASDER